LPLEKASRTAFVDVAVRSSYVYVLHAILLELPKAPSRAKTHIEIVVDDHHRRIAASALTLDLNHGELAILRRFSGLNSAKVAAHRFQDFGRAAEHARRRSAHLHKVLPNWVTRNISRPLARQDDRYCSR
jgi:hypothetical protein